MMDFASSWMTWQSLQTARPMQVTMWKTPSLKEQNLTTTIQTEQLWTRLKSLSLSNMLRIEALELSLLSTVLATWMLCLSLWKNWASQTLKLTLTRFQKQLWTLKTKKQWTLQKPLLASTWTSLQARLRSLTMVQMSMPMTLPMLKGGTTSSGMVSTVNLLNTLIV